MFEYKGRAMVKSSSFRHALGSYRHGPSNHIRKLLKPAAITLRKLEEQYYHLLVMGAYY